MNGLLDVIDVLREMVYNDKKYYKHGFSKHMMNRNVMKANL